MTRNGVVPIEWAASARNLAPAEHPPGRNGKSFVEWRGNTSAPKPAPRRRRVTDHPDDMCDRANVVCVDWHLLPVKEAVQLPDRSKHPDLRVYVIEIDGAPLYAGYTERGLGSRMRQHRFAQTPIGALVRKACDGLIDLDVRSTFGTRELEQQVIWALRPDLNVQGMRRPVYPLGLLWPSCPELRIAMHRVVMLRASGANADEIHRHSGISHDRIRKMLTWHGADGKPWMAPS